MKIRIKLYKKTEKPPHRYCEGKREDGLLLIMGIVLIIIIIIGGYKYNPQGGGIIGNPAHGEWGKANKTRKYGEYTRARPQFLMLICGCYVMGLCYVMLWGLYICTDKARNGIG